jgi:hypothetical protein
MSMIKKFYRSSDYRFLKEQASLVFDEVSDGIYSVVKNRMDYLSTIKLKTFATSEQVVQALNYCEKVVVVAHGSGSIGYTNWDFQIPRIDKN